ncbi:MULTISPECIES: DUF2834 domain-containing protein [unclassified Paracoccus (in: a-proteobacteria)]|uniref:DUF2834 domain-containing protein n=1 Tax=unclassified Paracoccus (in: a-proteobacteria) TaxID=2688777 RepID=UPI001353E201|nr:MULTISPECIES: DUF2834 domain-containing protein [unclassified Paracoccus (in: a-proteobacteria)]UXU75060.1 DUF2834 domain-containing protein [Paracoccus sp. SMMA_5]UXU80963.1 DUF2834 domain-containing protein [Paracoccus sp. SMMA_5_TC]
MSRPRSSLTPLRLVWLGLACLGAVVALTAPGGAGMHPGDVVGQAALAIWCVAETMVRRNWLALLTLPALYLGLGCALPLYLFIRSRRIT